MSHLKKIKSIVTIIFILVTFISKAQIQSPVKWSYVAKKFSDNEAVLYLKAKMQSGWHIYSVNQKEGGPQKTSFQLTTSKNHSLIGKIIEPKPIKKYEEVFDMDVLYFEKLVVFSQKIKLNAKSTVVKGKVEFMACTDKQCLPPSEVEFSIPVQ